MTKEIIERRKLLIDALRSGEFDQGRGQLRSSDKFCCLGVACEIYRRETGFGYWFLPDTEANESLKVYEFLLDDDDPGSVVTLPHYVKNWFGFKEENPRFITRRALGRTRHTVTKSLASLNDGDACYPYSFNDIAGVLEFGQEAKNSVVGSEN